MQTHPVERIAGPSFPGVSPVPAAPNLPAPHASGPATQLGVAVTGGSRSGMSVQSDIHQIRGDRIPPRPIGRVGLAHGDSMLLQASDRFVVEPRFVPKLDRVPDAAPPSQSLNKTVELVEIPMQGLRQLPQDHRQLRAQTRGAAALQHDRRQRLWFQPLVPTNARGASMRMASLRG